MRIGMLARFVVAITAYCCMFASAAPTADQTQTGVLRPNTATETTQKRKPAKANQGQARLTYSLYQGLLTGTADGRPVHIRAYSGGGGGSTKSPSDPFAVNNPVLTDQQQKGRQVRGGPIPVGDYIIQPPAQWRGGIAAVLIPKKTMKRGGFLIHGRGPLGSDGCIVPFDQREFRDLMERLTRDGGGVLRVVDAGPPRSFR